MSRLGRSMALLRLGLGVYWRASPPRVLAKVGLTLLGVAAPLGSATTLKHLVDGLVGDAPASRLVGLVTALSGLALLGAVTGPLDRYLDRELDRRIAWYSDNTLFGAVAGLEGIELLERPAFHDRLRMAIQGGESGPKHVAVAVLSVAQSVLLTAGFVGVLVTVSPLAAALVALGAGPNVVAQLRLGRRRVSVATRTTPRMRRRMFFVTLLTDSRAAKEIRLFGIGGYLRDRLLGEVAATQRQERALDRGTLITQSGLAVLTALVAATATAALVVRIHSGGATVGDLAVLTMALTSVQGAIASASAHLGTVHQATLMLEHFAYVRSLPSVESSRVIKPVSAVPRAGRRGIVFEDVWFRYGDGLDWVLSGLNLVIAPGESVALIGPNGAGKSTVVKLMCRLYPVTRGRILWDDQDIAELPVDDLRRRIVAVFQDFMTYELTAKENIAVAELSALNDPDRIAEAARWAGIAETLQRLPHGYDTMLSRSFEADPSRPGAPGTWLSGGQWQRLAIARAALRPSADLAILDEPSAGLDPEAEYEVHRRLRAYRAGRMSLLVSHRLNTVRDADRLLYLDRGSVREEGDHDTLLARGGEYARMFRLQRSGYDSEPESSIRQGAWS